jgi:hypothetical protein
VLLLQLQQTKVCVMGLFAKLLRQKADAGVDLATLAGDREALVETLLAQADAAHKQNVDYSLELTKHLGGNYKLVLNERPDGSGFFYGNLHDENGNTFRVDVMPPRHIWSGDFGRDAAHEQDWVAYLNGEEVQRAQAIEGFAVLTASIA